MESVMRYTYGEQSWRPGAEFGGTEIFLADQDFRMTFFSEKFRFSRPKFLMTFFQSLTRFFGISLSFPRFSVSFTMLNVVHTLSSQEQPLFHKRIPLLHLFLLCSYFRAHPTTLLLKIFGGRMHGPVPHLKFFGGPQSPYVSAPVGEQEALMALKIGCKVSVSTKIHPLNITIAQIRKY